MVHRSHHVRSCVVIRQNHLLAKIFDIPQENIIVNNAVYLTTVEEAMIVERGKENTHRDSRAFCGDDTFHVFSFFLKGEHEGGEGGPGEGRATFAGASLGGYSRSRINHGDQRNISSIIERV